MGGNSFERNNSLRKSGERVPTVSDHIADDYENDFEEDSASEVKPIGSGFGSKPFGTSNNNKPAAKTTTAPNIFSNP